MPAAARQPSALRVLCAVRVGPLRARLCFRRPSKRPPLPDMHTTRPPRCRRYLLFSQAVLRRAPVMGRSSRTNTGGLSYSGSGAGGADAGEARSTPIKKLAAAMRRHTSTSLSGLTHADQALSLWAQLGMVLMISLFVL